MKGKHPQVVRQGALKWATLLVGVLVFGVVVLTSEETGLERWAPERLRSKNSTSSNGKHRNKKNPPTTNNKNDDAKHTTVCAKFQLTTFNHAGSILDNGPKCADSAEALAQMIETAQDVVVMALGGGSSGSNPLLLDDLAAVVDDFLTPRLEWRIVAERFDGSRHDKLFYDPVVFAPAGTGTFGEPAGAALQTLLKEAGGGGGGANKNEEEGLLQGVDFLLVRVLDEKLVAVSHALRRYQFPGDNCDEYIKQTAGRIMLDYGGNHDFLWATTASNVRNMERSIQAGLPYAGAKPPVWGHVYRFDNCTSTNGLECAFLPTYGGKCLAPRVHAALECLGQFKTAYGQSIVLPKDGIPSHVCEEGHQQAPSFVNSSYEFYQKGGTDPPEAFVKWCSNCAFGGKTQKPSPDLVKNSTASLAFGDIGAIGRELPIRNYIHAQDGIGKQCMMDLRPLLCGGTNRTCCHDEVKIPDNVLGNQGSSNRPQVGLFDNAVSSFMTRFNRAARRRISRLHQPRMEAMEARNQGWRAALATGNCATLHIRRGDNIDRCKEGSTQFCAMNLTLAQYMTKAVPMMAQLNDSRHVFVMTDDAQEVTDEKLAPWQEKGYFLEVVSGYNQYSEETYNDWDTFLASLYAAQDCRVMLGHYISTVSTLVHRSICTRWGECPINDMMEGVNPGERK